MADTFYKSSFGGLRLWISRISTDKSRTQIKHELSAGDQFVVQDRGRSLLTARVTVLCDYMDGDDLSPIDRIRKLSSLVDDQPRVFSHPIEGSFLARVGPFTYEIDDKSVITAEVEFTSVDDVVAVAPVTAGTLLGPGAGAVEAAADAMTAELADIGLTSSSPAAAIAAANSWADTDLINPKDVLAKEGSLTQQLGAEADGYDGDMGMWSAFKSTVLLAETVRMAASAATADAPATFFLRTGTPMALRALLTSVYPADQAAERYDQVMSINDILSPAMLDVGSELEMPLPTPGARGF